MLEEANEIFNYLPIRTNPAENDYINHLWSAIEAISNGDSSAHAFTMMPFHLLFMLALQYKILRIAKEKNSEYLTCFTISVCQNSEKVSKPQSVYSLTELKERSMVDLLKLIEVDKTIIKKIKNLIDYRNDTLAHAKGGIEPNPVDRIEEYIQALRDLQVSFAVINNIVAERWKKEKEKDQEISEFVELHLAEEYLCPADFKSTKLSKYYSEINE